MRDWLGHGVAVEESEGQGKRKEDGFRSALFFLPASVNVEVHEAEDKSKGSFDKQSHIDSFITAVVLLGHDDRSKRGDIGVVRRVHLLVIGDSVEVSELHANQTANKLSHDDHEQVSKLAWCFFHGDVQRCGDRGVHVRA